MQAAIENSLIKTASISASRSCVTDIIIASLKLTESVLRIGVFGGTFNPPHSGHLRLAEMVRERFGLDRVLWIPNSRSPFKTGEELADAADRLAMVRAATAGNAAFSVSEIETRQRGASYTVETLRKLQEAHPGAAFRLMVGSDHLSGFSRWREPEEIARRAPLIVFPRAGHEQAAVPEGFGKYVEFSDTPRIDLSSTDIRKRIRAGWSVGDMVPRAVLEIIEERGLYR